jgi:carbamoyl-phosphate synthase large subunit
VLKPRNGSASRDLHIIQDEEELRFFFPRTPQPILQEYLNNNGAAEEFTCSVFVDRDGAPVGTFMARRELSGGATWRAEVGVWPEIHELLQAIGSGLRPLGVMNVQLRLTPRGPVPFEINIRCSGTSAIRAYYGFNEPEMLLRHYVLGETLKTPEVKTGYVMRYWNEVFLDGVSSDDLAAGTMGMKGNVLAWP